MSNAVNACTRAMPMLSRHVCARQELRACQEQQQHTKTQLYLLAQQQLTRNNVTGMVQLVTQFPQPHW
jgi:hypothetical protein